MAHWGIVSTANAKRTRSPSAALLGIALGSAALSVPLDLSGTREASAGSLVVGQERTSVLDALHTPNLVAVRAADPTGDAARFAIDGRDETVWTGRDGAAQSLSPSGDPVAQPTHRSWFVDADACALRLVVDRTNAGPPVLREVQAIEGARDVLRGGKASDDGVYPGFEAADAIDGTYSRRWVGAPNQSRWTLRVDLGEPQTIDRVRLVLGFDATSVARPGGGRAYAIAWAPIHYTLEASEDGRRFAPIASDPLRSDGTTLPLRRRLVTLAEPRTIRALRLVMV